MVSSRNQNRPPNYPLNKKDGGEEISLYKRRKVGGGGGGRLMRSTAASRARQVLSTVNSNNQDSASDAASMAETSESAEFTKEEVEALLNEKIKGKKFDLKGKLEQISESNKRLRLCIRWFQGVEQNLNQEQKKLRNSLNVSEKKYSAIEIERKIKEDELNSVNGELRQNNVVLQEKLAMEESDKLKAIECHTREKEARAAAEALNSSLTQELEKLRQEKSDVDLKVKSVNDMYTRLQEYNTSLQQYNSKLLTDLATVNEPLQRVEKEKSTIVENLGALRGHYATLQDQLTSFRASQKEGAKEKETLSNEINRLQWEYEIEKYKETTGKSVAELDNLILKFNALEVYLVFLGGI